MTTSPSRLSPKLPLPMGGDPETERLTRRSPSTAAQPDDAQFPQGQCRYILMVADLKGQRCGCVTFSHNKSLPGATCECGHLACFHMNTADVPSPGKNQDEIVLLRRRVHELEQRTNLSSEQPEWDHFSQRLSQVEDSLEKHQEEIRGEIKGSYKNVSVAWQLVTQMQQRLATFEKNQRIQSEQLQRAGKELEDLRNRNLELLEAEEMLEERIEKLESTETLPSPAPEPPSRISGMDASSPLGESSVGRRRRSSAHRPEQPVTTIESRHVAQHNVPSATEPDPSAGSWTIHVSLLPSKGQPFPFEKDTNAYKRCLSRGLQRMVAVEGSDATAFVSAVSRAFKDILGRRAWEPLQAKLCDARRLEGLPMLRALDPDLAQLDFDARFIRKYCAVCDVNGRMESMYVTTSHGSLSWPAIRCLPTFVEGLESSWDYDRHLDGTEGEDAEVGDKDAQYQPLGKLLITQPSPSSPLKRDAAEMQAGHLTKGLCLSEDDGPRTKISRTYMPELFEVRRGVEAAL